MSISNLPKQTNMRKRIGSTVYEVNVFFKQEAKETINDKILRLVKNDLQFSVNSAIVGLPLTGRVAGGFCENLQRSSL